MSEKPIRRRWVRLANGDLEKLSKAGRIYQIRKDRAWSQPCYRFGLVVEYGELRGWDYARSEQAAKRALQRWGI